MNYPDFAWRERLYSKNRFDFGALFTQARWRQQFGAKDISRYKKDKNTK